jgi:exodeoxyribonuclease V beta subunit
MQTLDAKTVPLTGTNLIEASAGTGKTWTISWLYLRLVAVYGLRVDQILVVTYTEAATAELRDRIRKRLADALAFLENRTSEEPYETLLEEAELPQCIQRLQLALVSFDEAAVFTIHGFCKRVLTENAFEARLPFESELVTNEDSLLTELTDKFWYQHFLTPDTLHLNLLQKHNLTPDNLLATVRSFIGKPYLHEDIPAVDAENFSALQTTFNSALQASQETWATERDTVLGLLLSGALNGSTYRKDYVQKWAEKLDAGLGDVGFPADILERFTPASLREKTKAGKATPSHAFFNQVETLLAAYTALHTSETAALEHLRLQLLHHLRRELPIRKQQLGILTFDDLLLHLNKALEQHADFAPRLAAKYRAALIDEFQDTDPIQYAIFGRIYCDAPEPRVFYVGDPKQAIYGFRGADIYTYLQAAQTTEHKHTLGKNFRSHPDLLKALNHLFKQSDDPFRSAITYEPVEAGKPQSDIFLPSPLEGEGLGVRGIPPLRLWNWDSLDEHNATQLEDLIAEATADDIAHLLTAGQQGIATVGDEALQSKHIAVLVRTGKQGERVRQALLARGISSVQKSRDSIFRTREAAELRAVLRAIAEPGSESALKQALVTELFAYNASQLYALDQQPELLETELEAFHAWHKVWHTQGFMPMFRQMLRQRGLYAHLLAFADGERRLTNLLHLAELIHTESRLHGHGMHALIRWLQQRASSAEEQDAHQLRLESDANLVQIVTIHKSKGLEYGVVYCPYLWQERDAKARTWFSWYDDSGEEGKSRLQADSLADDAQRASFWKAERAENLRLLYVALTRAKYHCTVTLVSGLIPKFDYYSALGWLLFGGMPQHKDILGKALKGGMPPEERQRLMQQRLQEVVDTSDGCIGLEPLPVTDEPIRYQPEVRTAAPEVHHYNFTLPPVPKVGSFSGLAAGKDDEKPDYDVLAFASSQFAERSRSEAGKNEPFPRGAQAGSCLHKMLEELDFMQALAGQREKVLVPALQRHGMAERWLGAAERLLDNALNTPLQTRLALSAIPKSRRLDELEFYFPVERLRLKPLQRILHQHLPAAWTDIHAAIDKLKFNTLTGYMKGFVDLVFEAGGRYFIVDYKSNELGSAADDYTPDAMQQAMAEHHYYLQYLIYCLALHRYLCQRIQDYAWETHAGGALYLFLRGMQPNIPGSGVFFHKPDAALIDALDDLMQA